jgi:hypothetical protein
MNLKILKQFKEIKNGTVPVVYRCCSINFSVMGLTIHYSGRINPEASLESLIGECLEFANVFHWKYHIFEREFPQVPFPDDYNDNIYGISISPPESEPLWFTFLSNGKMSGPAQLQFFGKNSEKENLSFLYSLFTKTQFAGPEIHILVIEIFRHISKKYLLDFTMSDEGKYCETGNREELETIFKQYNFLLDMFEEGLKHSKPNKGESLQQMIERIAAAIHSDYRKRKF